MGNGQGSDGGACSMIVSTTTVVIQSTVTVTPGAGASSTTVKGVSGGLSPTGVVPSFPMNNGTDSNTHSRHASSGFLTQTRTGAAQPTGSAWYEW